jgi:hypothetical protein
MLGKNLFGNLIAFGMPASGGQLPAQTIHCLLPDTGNIPHVLKHPWEIGFKGLNVCINSAIILHFSDFPHSGLVCTQRRKKRNPLAYP